MNVRTHRCGELTKSHVGKTVVLNGWVQRRRDHGIVMFIVVIQSCGQLWLIFEARHRNKEIIMACCNEKSSE